MKLYPLLLIIFLAGCTETRSVNESQTSKSDRISVSGSAVIPSPTGNVVVPIEFKIDRTGTEEQHSEGQSKTQIDSAAIAQQVGDVVGKLVDSGIAKITGISKPSGLSLTEGGALGGAGGAMAYALREMLARKREEKALIEVKAARNAAQAEALALAKKLPPEQV